MFSKMYQIFCSLVTRMYKIFWSFIWNYFFFFYYPFFFKILFWGAFHLGALVNDLIGLVEGSALTTDIIFDGWIRDMKFNFYLHQKSIGILVW